MKSAVLFLEPRGTILEVARAAKARGFAVLALSSDFALIQEAPAPYDTAAACIDEVVQIVSWQDAGEVLEATTAFEKKYRIAGVYYGSDPCAVVGAKLRAKYSPSARLRRLTAERHAGRGFERRELSRIRQMKGLRDGAA